MKDKYPLLDKIQSPADLRKLNPGSLPVFCEELRQYLIETVSDCGGHFAAGLGVVEITTALHYIFNTPHDRLVWDVGHQSYPHKILTGRKEQLKTIRRKTVWLLSLPAVKVNTTPSVSDIQVLLSVPL